MEVINVIKGFGIELTAEQESQIQSAVGKEYVLRSDFNTKNSLLKDANKKISELEARDFSSVEIERDDWKNKYESLNLQVTNDKKKSKFFELLGDDCKDKEYILYKHGGVDKLELEKDGSLKDADNLIKSLKEDNASYFGKQPVVVSSTPGKDPNAASTNDRANEALRSLLGK